MKIKIMDNKTGEVKVVIGEVVDNRENYFTVKCRELNRIGYHSYPKTKYQVEINHSSIFRVEMAILFYSERLGEIFNVLSIPKDVVTYPHLELYLNQIYEVDDISVIHFEEFKGYPIRF